MCLKIWSLFFFLCLVLYRGVDTQENVNFKAVIRNMIELSYPINNVQPSIKQFGYLMLYEKVGNIEVFDPLPVTDNGRLPFDDPPTRLRPSNQSLWDNYLVSKPIQLNGSTQFTHVEDHVLRIHGDALLNSYRNKRNREATHAVLYTYNSPCNGCMERILEFYNEHSHNIHFTLAYTEIYQNLHGNINNIRNAGVDVILMKNGVDCIIPPNNKKRRSTGPSKCELNTFQGCLLHQLDHFCCFQNHSDKVVFVNAFAAECFPDFHKTCLDFLIEARFSACSSSKEKLLSSFDHLVQNCSSKALSNPLQASAPNVFTGLLDCPNCLQTPPKSCSLKQVSACGHRGTLCTTAAGNSLCRDDHYCGLHNSSYAWCYIDDEDSWDYCCLGSCKMDSQKDAMMCFTGQATDNATNTQQSAMYRYCGDAGTQTVTGEDCNASHPCGTHNGTDYYWCYTQSGLGWDYCCRPDQVCGKKGQDFNWCLVGRNSSKMECNPAREAECDNKPFDEEESCPCNTTCSSQGSASESSTVIAAMPVLVLQSLLVCLLVATHALD